jgi:hypothetical protein
VVAAGKAQLGCLVEARAGLVDALLAGKDDAGEDQRLRLCASLGETLIDQ